MPYTLRITPATSADATLLIAALDAPFGQYADDPRSVCFGKSL